MTPRSFVSLTVLAATLALALTACVPEPPAAGPTTSPAPTGTATAPATPGPTTPTLPGTPTATPSPTATTTPSPTPSPTATAGASDRAVLPSCGTLLPLSTVHALFGDAAEPLDAGGSAADHMPGPLAAETAARAVQSEVCSWGIPFSDGGFSVVAAELTTAARDRLVSSLRTAASYRATTIAGATAFTHSEESEFGTIAVVYVFTGRVWITVTGTLTVETGSEFAGSALDAVRAANA
ncbi:hypothetical protein [Microbacterium sp. PA5]|uniref:hypothetical protein n=1 Tax=Microbacterium sp. PA5 TaxID=3416654 RepID=UPI003CF73F39